MTSTVFSICIKLGKITDQIIGKQREIVPGDLIKEINVNNSINPDRTVIKVYDRDNKTFGKQIYQCDKENIKLVDKEVWTFVSEAKEGTVVTLNVGDQRKVNFLIKRVCDVPTLGFGRFFALDIIDNLSEDEKFPIRMKYYNKDQAAYCVRVDKVIDILEQPLIVNNFSMQQKYQTPPKLDQYPLSATGPNRESRTVPEVPELSLIDFGDETQSFTSLQTTSSIEQDQSTPDLEIREEGINQSFNPLKTFAVPPVFVDVNQMRTASRFDYVDPQLQYLRNGLSDLRVLTENYNGMNEYARTINEIDKNLKDFQIERTNLVGSMAHTKHSTPPSHNYYSDPSSAMQSTIKDFRTTSIRSSQGTVPPVIMQKINKQTSKPSLPDLKFTPFELPAVQREYVTYNVTEPGQAPFVAPTTPPPTNTDEINVTKQKFPPSKPSLPDLKFAHIKLPVVQRKNESYNVIEPDQVPFVAPTNTGQINAKKPKFRKNNKKSNNSNITTNCYKCHKSAGSAIQLDCQHVFCSQCLLSSLSSLEDACCPFKNGKYSCQYKLQIDDVKFIIEAVSNTLSESGKNNTQIRKQKLNKENQREVFKKTEEDAFVYNGDESDEVLYACKQAKCDGMWFIDRKEGRNTYPCPLCGTYNCFKCGVIHDNMTCEEYNQHNPGRRILENRQPANNFNQHDVNRHTWKCKFCDYGDNLMDTAICVFCSHTDGEILSTKNSNRGPTNDFNQHDNTGHTWKCKFCSYGDNIMDTAICALCYRTDDEILSSKNSNATEYYRLLELEENNNFIPNFDEFECVICVEMIEPANGVQLRGCLHNFCQNCIRTYIEGRDEPDIKCPFDGCTNVLEDREIKTLVPPQAYARHLEISLRVGKQQIKNGYQCCIPNCQGWWVFTEGTFKYNCPACRTENCISCKASHPNVDCKKYQQDLFYSTDRNGVETRQRLEQMLKNGEAEHCPSCNIIVVKNGGCAHMVCSMCRTNFNWGQKANRNLNLK